ncbi:TonB-dependent siderophore receptor [Achromobacter pulmonis]|uniref:TonB-dependent siderophore receptor n=1 Tax=Achromobacter pulmonis TaxID=1389932 RepID=UPI001EEE3C07|nr:TonB-dependent siderophore receptor [Achromobacter pulmonis]MCF7770942.1 TonB-dependent siderophore receptor [Achromobacter pulmonis]
MFPVRPAPQLAAAFLIALAAPAGIAQAQTGAQSGAAMPQRYDLPAAPLAETLTRIARQSGHAVSVDPALVAGRQALAVAGTYTPEQALREALAGSGLELRITANGTFSARPLPQAGGATLLEPVRVTGAAESTGGYVNKYMDNSAKFVDSIKDTPRSITVVPQQLIQDTSSSSLNEALKYVPGMSFKSGDALARPGGDHPTLRGFDATDAITLDGVRNTASQSRESFDIESVEVIKGPAAIYNGRGNAGGSINIVAKKPFLGKSITKTSAGLGSDNYRRATIDSNIDLRENVAARVNLMWHESDKPKRNLVNYSRWGAAPSVLISIDEKTSLLLSYYHLYSNDTPDYSTPFDKKTGEILDTPRDLFYGAKNRDYIINRVDTPEMVFSHEFGNGATVRNTTLYSRTVQQFIATSPAISKEAGESNMLFLQGKSGDFRTRTFSNLTDFTKQFRIASMLHKISAGFEYTVEENKRKSMMLTVKDPSGKAWNIRSQPRGFSCAAQGMPTYTCTPVGVWNPYSPWLGQKTWEQEGAYPATSTKNKTVSGYLFDSVNLTDDITVSVGGRYDYYKTHVDAIGKPSDNVNTSNWLFNYHAGMVWNPVQAVSLYGSWSTSSNPANSDAIQGGIADKNKENFKPEKFTNLEIGVKWSPLSEQMLLGLSWFDTKQKNGHFAVEPNVSEPIGEQGVKGIEFNVEGNITDRWSIFGGYSWLDSKITRSTRSSEIGNRIPLAPEKAATLWTKYKLTEKLYVGAGAAYTGKTYTNTKNSASVPGYVTMNAMAKYRINNRSMVQVNLNNIFDARHYSSLYPSFANYGPGRQIIGSLEYSF